MQKTRSMAEWSALFEATDCCVTPVLYNGEAIAHPHTQVGGLAIPREHPSGASYVGTTQAPRFS